MHLTGLSEYLILYWLLIFASGYKSFEWFYFESTGFSGDSVIKNLPAMQETWVLSLSLEDPLKKEMATHSSILAWEISWTEKPGRLESVGLQRIGHDLVTKQTHPESITLLINHIKTLTFISGINGIVLYRMTYVCIIYNHCMNYLLSIFFSNTWQLTSYFHFLS